MTAVPKLSTVSGFPATAMMKPPFIRSLRLDGFLSFAPGSDAIELQPLNVLIGPNGSGKSNFLEAFSLLSALPNGEHFQSRIRMGGGVDQWIWKGGKCDRASLDLQVCNTDTGHDYRYQVGFSAHAQLANFVEESFEDLAGVERSRPMGYFRIEGKGVEVATKFIGSEGPDRDYTVGISDRQYFRTDTSLMSQRSNADSYPDTFWLATQFKQIQEFRDWTFGGWGALSDGHSKRHRRRTRFSPTGATWPCWFKTSSTAVY